MHGRMFLHCHPTLVKNCVCAVCGVRALVSPAQVEQHNSHVQSNFAQRMDAAFGELQQRLQQQEGSQRHLLAGYTRAVGQHREFNKKNKNKRSAGSFFSRGG